MDDAAAWERLPTETEKAWEAFQIYRDLGSKRGIAAVQEVMRRTPGYRRQLQTWASQYNWEARGREYDNHLDRVTRLQREQGRRDEYTIKIERYRRETEEVGRGMISVGAKAVSILQAVLQERLNAERREQLSVNEISTLMRASALAIDVGSKLVGEALGVDTLVTTLIDEKDQRQT